MQSSQGKPCDSPINCDSCIEPIRDCRMLSFGTLPRISAAPFCRSQTIIQETRTWSTTNRSSIEPCNSANVSDVYLLTETASMFFSRFGFESIPRTKIPMNVQQSIEFTTLCPDTATVMRKMLPRSAIRFGNHITVRSSNGLNRYSWEA